MTSYVTPKKGVEFICYAGLFSQANTKILQSNPTLATGDAKVSIDGGAFANLSTLPAVTPASGKSVKITLSTSEMNGDNITVVLSDASGDEWCDLIINIQTSAQQIDDLSSLAAQDVRDAMKLAPSGGAVAGGSIDDMIAANETNINDIQDRIPTALVSGRIDASVGAMQSGVVTAAAIATGAIDADALATDAVAEIADGVWDEARSGHTTAGTYGESFLGVVNGQAATGTLSTTAFTTNLTEATNDHYNGRIVVFITGVLAGQATDITDYDGSSKLVTVTAMTEAPSNGDRFVIV